MTDSSLSPAASGPSPNGVVRIATFQAQPGRMADLIAAAHGNAATALEQDGCLSAEAVTDPNDGARLLVVSRWQTAAQLQAYLQWHQGIAHSSMAEASVGKPVAAHYPVV